MARPIPSWLLDALHERGRLYTYLTSVKDERGTPVMRLDSGHRSVCPFHGGESKDFAYFRGPDRWRCFSAHCPTNAPPVQKARRVATPERATRDILDFQMHLRGHTELGVAARELAEHFGIDVGAWTATVDREDPDGALRRGLERLYLSGVGRLWEPGDSSPDGAVVRAQLAQLGVTAARIAHVAEDALPALGDQADPLWSTLPESERMALAGVGLTPERVHARLLWPHFADGSYTQLDGLSNTAVPSHLWEVDRRAVYHGARSTPDPIPVGWHSTPAATRLSAEPWVTVGAPLALIALREAGVPRSMATPTLPAATSGARAYRRHRGERLLLVPDTAAAKQHGWSHACAAMEAGQDVALIPLPADGPDFARQGPDGAQMVTDGAAWLRQVETTALDPVEWQVETARALPGDDQQVWLARRVAPLLRVAPTDARRHQYVLDVAQTLGQTPAAVAAACGIPMPSVIEDRATRHGAASPTGAPRAEPKARAGRSSSVKHGV